MSILRTQEESQRDKKRVRITWDEANLEHNEMTKTPRMKIDEPPTPYVPPRSWSDDEEEEAENVVQIGSPSRGPQENGEFSNMSESELQRNLELIANEAERRRNAESEEGGGEGEGRSSGGFELKRKMHYDEGHKFKELLARKGQLDEVDGADE